VVEQIPNETPKDFTDIDIIQGGMGVGISDWRLAGAVAAEGAMGIVSGTLIGPVLARRLQNGDPDGSLRQALEAFPNRDISRRTVEKYYISNGRQPNQPYKSVPMYDAESRSLAVELNMVGAFVEVWLAKRLAAQNNSSPGPIGMNLLTKLQAPTLSALYGAILAEADCIIMGAGIPYQIPKALGDLALGLKTSIRFDVTGAKKQHEIIFDPGKFSLQRDKPYIVPKFLAIVSSNTLAKRLSGNVSPPSGFVIEGFVAGGHNALPRDKIEYGDKDLVNLDDIKSLGFPFWLAGGYDSPDRLKEAKGSGANGIQAGTAFLLCQESGIDPTIRAKIIDKVIGVGISVKTDMLASPTGLPFKVALLAETLSETEVYEMRDRKCDLGYLREPYAEVQKDGREVIKYRCAAEPVEDYRDKGGNIEDTIGRICLCNGLLATIRLGQTRHGIEEKPIITSGDILCEVTKQLVTLYGPGFSAGDVVRYLHSE
jgi:nitronate monooxygenase